MPQIRINVSEDVLKRICHLATARNLTPGQVLERMVDQVDQAIYRGANCNEYHALLPLWGESLDKAGAAMHAASDEPKTLKDFARLWSRLANEGVCDSIFGAEYSRVVSEWNDAGKPAQIERFIRERANVGPTHSS